MEPVAADPGPEVRAVRAAKRARRSTAEGAGRPAAGFPVGPLAVRSAVAAPGCPACSAPALRAGRHPESPAPVADRWDSAATRAHRAAPDTARWARTDPVLDRRPRTAAGCPVAGTSPAAAHTSTVSPAPQPVPGDPGCPRSTGGAGGGAPLEKRVPFGSGHLKAGNPALRQKFSGSMPRFLNAASTHGCRIW